MSEMSHATANPIHGNGTAVAPLSDEQMKQLVQQDLIVSATFARIVSVLMRSPHYKHFALTDLGWLVMPLAANDNAACSRLKRAA